MRNGSYWKIDYDKAAKCVSSPSMRRNHRKSQSLTTSLKHEKFSDLWVHRRIRSMEPPSTIPPSSNASYPPHLQEDVADPAATMSPSNSQEDISRNNAVEIPEEVCSGLDGSSVLNSPHFESQNAVNTPLIMVRRNLDSMSSSKTDEIIKPQLRLFKSMSTLDSMGERLVLASPPAISEEELLKILKDAVEGSGGKIELDICDGELLEHAMDLFDHDYTSTLIGC